MTHPEESRKQDRLTPTLMLFAIVLLASWMGATNGGYFVGEWTLVTLVLAVLALIASVAGLTRSPKSWWATAALGLAAAYTAWTFASIFWSPNRGEAWLGAGQTLLYVLAFWLALVLVSLLASRRWVLAASVIGPAIIAAFTLLTLPSRLQDLASGDTGPGQVLMFGRVLGTVGYFNGEAAFLLVPFWVGVHLAGSRRINPILRGAALAGSVLGAQVAVLTQSRGAVAAMAVSLPVFFLLSGQRLRGLVALAPVAGALLLTFPSLSELYPAFASQDESAGAVLEQALSALSLTAVGAGLYGTFWGCVDSLWRPPRNAMLAIRVVVAAASIILIVFSAVVVGERVGNPVAWAEQRWEAFKVFEPPFEPTEQNRNRYLIANGSGRYVLWQVAWEDFASHPLLGVGTQNYEATYYQLREKDVGYVRYPHSLPLEVLSERGLVGGILFFGFLVTCLGAGLQQRFRNLTSEGKGQIGAMIAAITYWFVHSSVEWFWQFPAVTLPVIAYLAMLAGPWRRIETPPLRWPLRVLGASVALLAMMAVAPLFVADRYVAQSYSLTDTEETLRTIERAQVFNPLNAEFFQREAEVAAQIGNWDRAEEAYRNAIRLNPEHFAPYMELARFYERRGDFATALSYFQQALDRNPLDAELDRPTIAALLTQDLGQRNITVRFKSGSTELGSLRLMMANSASESEHRLQESAALPPDAGILFAWPPSDIMGTFWTTHEASNLDIAFIDLQGEIAEITAVSPSSEERVQPQQQYPLAIGTKHGFFDSWNIRPGSQVTFEFTP